MFRTGVAEGSADEDFVEDVEVFVVSVVEDLLVDVVSLTVVVELVLELNREVEVVGTSNVDVEVGEVE